MPDRKFVQKKFTTTMRANPASDEGALELLWGDGFTPTGAVSGAWVEGRARGMTGWVRAADLGAKSLLEVYFIDVGQGDGVLIRTPTGRHVLIDGGYTRTRQPLGKNAADFVDWKFFKDYGSDTIHLDAMIASHCDADHYGGLWDLLEPTQQEHLDATKVQVDALYHSGVAWQRKPNGDRWLGREDSGWLIDLMRDRASIEAALDPLGTGPKLQGEWKQFMKAGFDRVPAIGRLDRAAGFVPGFAPAAGDASLKVLGPVIHTKNGRDAVRDFGPDSKNTNGHSSVLRLDFGRARILLTGDLNRASQQALLEEWQGQHGELECDVAKGCHHGSDDVSWKFLSAMKPAASVISSGDAEGHAHPRPSIVAASGLAGFRSVDDAKDALRTPIVYSTEISRSVDFGRIQALRTAASTIDDFAGWNVDYRRRRPGDLQPKTGSRPLKNSFVVTGVVYGLVNVRTDGETILCATRNEADHSWDTESFAARF